MKQFLEGSYAIAEVIKLCRPGVISAYPITPQTHIVEGLAEIIANGELNAEFINVESEHSAASVVLGASATGVRTFTATSSQGFLLMVEVLFNIAGMRLPIIMTCANRAVSAPINIWNDHQDSVTVRDSGWIQFYAETIQEAVDMHIQAYRIAENPQIALPVMICIDGYLLTHGVETVDIPEQKLVDEFLPPFKPVMKLDPQAPITMGVLGGPDYYMETRFAIQKALDDALKLIPTVCDDFGKKFNRISGGLMEGYKLEDAKSAIITMGSVAGTVKETVDELRAKGQKVGGLRVITYRPFPKEEIYNALKNVSEIAVLEKAIGLGGFGPLYADIKTAFQGRKENPKVSGFVIGLGGRDVTKNSIKTVFSKLAGKQTDCEFIDLVCKTGENV